MTKEEMFLEIYLPNIILRHLDKFKKFRGVTSSELIKEDINGTTYKFIGKFNPDSLVTKVKKYYQQEHDKYQDSFGKTLKEEISKMKDEGLLDKEDT